MKNIVLISALLMWAAPAWAQGMVSPENVYLNYSHALHKAETIDELQQYYTKADFEKLKNYDQNKGQNWSLKTVQEMNPTNSWVTNTQLQGNRAALTVESNLPKKGRGLVNLVMEDGQWRVDDERWEFSE